MFVHRLHPFGELDVALPLLPPIVHRAADEVDVADVGLGERGAQRLLQARVGDLVELGALHDLAQLAAALVGSAVGAKRAAQHLPLVGTKVLAGRRRIDHRHVAVQADAGPRHWKAVGGLAGPIHPGKGSKPTAM